MEKEDLIADVAQKANMSVGETTKIVDAFIEAVKEGLKSGEKVTILGFGTFSLRKRKALNFLNPKTRNMHEIPERLLPHFKAGKNLQDSLKS